MKFAVPLIAAAVGLAAGTAQAQTRPQAITLNPQGDWQVRAFGNQQGQFAHCAAQVQTDNNAAIMVQRRADNETVLILQAQGGGFPTEGQIQAKVDVDGKTTKQLRAVAPQPAALLIGGVDNELLEAMRRGNRLNIEVGGKSYGLALKGTGKAIGDLRSCVETQGRSLQQAQAGQPAGQQGGQPQQPAQPQRPPIAATRPVTILPPGLIDVLIEAGLQNGVPLPMDGVPRQQRPGDYAWQLGPVVGAIVEVPIPPESNFEAAGQKMMDDLKSGCTADFKPELAATETVGPLQLRTGKFTCATAGGPIHSSLLFYVTPERILTRIMHYVPVGEAAQADRARDAVTKVIRERAVAFNTAPQGGQAPASGQAPAAQPPAQGQAPAQGQPPKR
ncbi:MAG TPA: hypothetical protein VEY95_00925 [Azospirillaceae bacterium]|nr:hypothetical protein [Azospirillaceae bacterium]